MSEAKRRFMIPISGSVAGNALFQLAGGFLTQLIGFLSGIWLARALGVADYGRFALVQSYVGIFYVFSDLGMNNIIVRELSQRRGERESLFFNSLMIKLALGLAALGAYLLWAGHAPYDPSLKKLFLCAAPIVLANALMTVTVVYRTFLVIQYPTVFAVLGRALFLGGIVTIAWSGKPSLTAVVLWSSATIVLELLANFALVQRWIRLRWTPNFDVCRGLAREAAPMAFIILIGTGYLRMDPVFLSLLSGDRAVGFYATAFALYQVALWVPNVLTTTYLPHLSERARQGPESLKQGLIKLWKILWPAALLTVAVGAGGARFWMRLLYGPTYEASIRPLEIMLLAALPAFMSYPAIFALIAQKNQSLNARVFSGAVVVSALCNLYWIPPIGAAGAALATVAREFFVWGGTMLYLRRTIPFSGGPGRGFWTLGFTAAAWGAALFAARDNVPAFAGTLLVGAAVYAAAVLRSGYWSAEDWAWIRESLGGGRKTP